MIGAAVPPRLVPQAPHGKNTFRRHTQSYLLASRPYQLCQGGRNQIRLDPIGLECML